MKNLLKEFSVFLVLVVGIPILCVLLFPDFMDKDVQIVLIGGLAGLTVGCKKFF